MAKKKQPVRRKKKAPAKAPPIAQVTAGETIEPDYAAAGKHLADAFASLSKAIELVRSPTAATAWRIWWQ